MKKLLVSVYAFAYAMHSHTTYVRLMCLFIYKMNKGINERNVFYFFIVRYFAFEIRVKFVFFFFFCVSWNTHKKQ